MCDCKMALMWIWSLLWLIYQEQVCGEQIEQWCNYIYIYVIIQLLFDAVSNSALLLWCCCKTILSFTVYIIVCKNNVKLMQRFETMCDNGTSMCLNQTICHYISMCSLNSPNCRTCFLNKVKNVPNVTIQSKHFRTEDFIFI